MKISIITAVYNNKDSIVDAIKSVQNQTYYNIEHIIIDGGSTDGTVELIESLDYQPTVFISEPDTGIYDALNKGIIKASGDVIGFMHSDDMYDSERSVQKIADSFQNVVDMVYGDLQYVRKDDIKSIVRYWKSGEYSTKKLRRGWMPPHPTVYLRREVYEKYGLFDTSFRIAADYDYMLRVLSDNTRVFKYIPEVLVKMRVGGESNSMLNYQKKWCEDLRAMRKNNIGGVPTLFVKNASKVFQFFQ